MSSRLATSTYNFASQLALKAKARAMAGTPIQTLSIRGPFSGLVPDADPNLVDGTSFEHLENVLARPRGADHGEVLGLPDGYRQVDPARLPLGDTSPPADAATAKPIVRLDQFSRFAPTTHATNPGEFTGEFIATPMAVTAGDGTTPASGNIYRVKANGQWTLVGPASSMAAAGRQLMAKIDGRSTSKSMGHSCTAPFGAAARADTSAAPGDNGQSGAIVEPAWIYTNDFDRVMVFPSSSAETNVGTHTYEPLVDAANSGGRLEPFLAKSVATWNGRVYFLNTSEAGTRHNQRLRRTAKFTCDPEDTNVGAGFYDFRDFQGEGLRVEPLGDVLAVYFSDGVALVRPTGVETSPDQPQVIATERGLLATHAVTSIGRNAHFGVFTDGWWLLDQSGRWQEVGITALKNQSVPKWRQSFYDLLDTANKHRLYVYYDQPSNLVYIALPTKDDPDPTQVWIYDPVSDRVFMENYPVTCFGTFSPLVSTAVTIDALPGSIDSLTGSIDSYSAVVGFPKVRVHGDLLGFVYNHTRDLEGYDPQTIAGGGTLTPQAPAWSFGLGLRSPNGMRNLSTVDRVSLEYFNHQNQANVSIEVSGPQADGSQSQSVRLDSGGPEDVRYRDAWFRYSSTAIGITVSGSGTFHIRSLEVDVMADPLEPRGK